jgi:hypothetical protein
VHHAITPPQNENLAFIGALKRELFLFIFRRLMGWGQMVSEQTPAVLVVMTIDTEIFPVGAIRIVVHAVPVLVMNCQEVSILIIKLPATFGTDEPVYFKRLLPITVWGIAGLFQRPYYFVNGFSAVLLPGPLHSEVSIPVMTHIFSGHFNTGNMRCPYPILTE